MINQIIISSFC